MDFPPEATEADADLDIYLFNPGGQLVAQSTAGGTNEQIDITLPANGTWSLFVHGWAAPGGDSDYDLYSWIISATPGGNLAITSAPTSATIGATETIVRIGHVAGNLPAATRSAKTRPHLASCLTRSGG